MPLTLRTYVAPGVSAAPRARWMTITRSGGSSDGFAGGGRVDSVSNIGGRAAEGGGAGRREVVSVAGRSEFARASVITPAISTSEESARLRLMNAGWSVVRSEEHTSELQSQSNLVCRLLL